MKNHVLLAATLALTVVLAACSGGQEGTADNQETPAAETPAATQETPAATAQTPEDAPAEPEVEKDPNRFVTTHDANATYAFSDLPTEGSFLKVQFNDLSDGQMNRVVHRLKTEHCTCGCPKDTIEECMVNDPACGTAPELARQIIREEKSKG